MPGWAENGHLVRDRGYPGPAGDHVVVGHLGRARDEAGGWLRGAPAGLVLTPAHGPRDVPSPSCSIPWWISGPVERGSGQPAGRAISRLDICRDRNTIGPWPALPRRRMSSTPLPIGTGAKS